MFYESALAGPSVVLKYGEVRCVFSLVSTLVPVAFRG
jgi:hypothetical protein